MHDESRIFSTPLKGMRMFFVALVLVPIINHGTGWLDFSEPVRDYFRSVTMLVLFGVAINIAGSLLENAVHPVIRAWDRWLTRTERTAAKQPGLLSRALPWFLRLLPPRMRADAEAFIRELVDVWEEDRKAGKSRLATALKFAWWFVVLISMALIKKSFAFMLGKWLGS